MTNEHENLQIENDLGTFEGFNHRTQSAIFPNVTADELVNWDHDKLGEAEFWHSGDKPGISAILDSNDVSASDVLALDRLLSELGDDIQTLAKLLYHIKHQGYSLQQIKPREIEDCPASYFIQDVSFVDLRRTAAYELFELYYPEEYRVWEKSTCDGLSFDVDHFLDSPAFSTAEFKIGEERILVVELTLSGSDMPTDLTVCSAVVGTTPLAMQFGVALIGQLRELAFQRVTVDRKHLSGVTDG